MMKSYLQGAKSVHKSEDITTEKGIPFCQKLVMSGAIDQIRQTFMTQPIVHSDRLLFKIAQVVSGRQNERAGLALVEHTSKKDGPTNPSNKIMPLVFVSGVPQIRQPYEMLQRTVDLGWTWGLIALDFHGQSSKQSNDEVLTDPAEPAPSHRFCMCHQRDTRDNLRVASPLYLRQLCSPLRLAILACFPRSTLPLFDLVLSCSGLVDTRQGPEAT